jgi:hypothetical protein
MSPLPALYSFLEVQDAPSPMPGVHNIGLQIASIKIGVLLLFRRVGSNQSGQYPHRPIG